MAWEDNSFVFYESDSRRRLPGLDTLGVNKECFIRKEHKCEKLFGASKSCFIACPTDDDLEPILELISEKLTKVGVEPIIAVKERAYGQDIFCTKICGKIIESRFCLVILNDTINNSTNIPNPNVYYEYGLMTSMKKHIIPLQRENLELAFNIQSYDTIKYNPKNIASELDRAIKDALKITEAKEFKKEKSFYTDKFIFQCMEKSEFKPKDDKWYLSSAIEDTNFKGFGQHDKGIYVYIGRIDDKSEFRGYLEDLDVVLHRTEKKYCEIIETIKEYEDNLKELIIREKTENIKQRPKIIRGRTEKEILQKNIESKTNIKELMNSIYIAFIIDPKIDSNTFIRQAEVLISNYNSKYNRYKLIYQENEELVFDDIVVSFRFLEGVK